jgi:hypothetical protein
MSKKFTNSWTIIVFITIISEGLEKYIVDVIPTSPKRKSVYVPP